MLDAAIEAGCTNWDSANIYGDSEELLGKWYAFGFSPVGQHYSYLIYQVPKNWKAKGCVYCDQVRVHQLWP